ncbi:alkaline phosphatase [Colwellia ponticola]|uniref:Alkaline phosphatase n=2 Tax=Colwellia ponticola TaxID=2304625 RepID=A0A8H2PJX1_9GAMM|nr:alkaline phosphatase [Colwellia ponticola]
MFISKLTTTLFSTLIIFNGISLSTYSCAATIDVNKQTVVSQQDLPKNIIMVVADGMGPAYTSAYRYFNDDPTTVEIEQTVFERHLKGLSSTYPEAISGYVTDSAAAATALATGIKTYNGAISVDVDKKPLLTVLQWAKQQGKKTGVVVTSRINHATPASYLSHNESRKNYNELANSYIDNGIQADVYFGGGWKNYIRDDRNIVAEFTQAGFQYIDRYSQLNTLKANQPVLGLFAKTSLPWALDDSNKHRLTPLTQTAIKQLTNQAGFFMLVEASQIDWGGHDNDIAAAMHEMDDLANVMLYLESFVAQNPDTLVVLTADHSTGGFTLAANKDYRWEPQVLRSMKHSITTIAEKIIAQDKLNDAASHQANTQLKRPIKGDQISQWLNFPLSTTEIEQLQQVEPLFHAQTQHYALLDKRLKEQQSPPSLKNSYRRALLSIIDKRTNTGWTTSGHTAIDVPVFAFGKHSEQFSGQLDNTDIANKIFSLLGK